MDLPSHRSRASAELSGSLVKAVLWLVLALVGLSAPYLIATDFAPAWLQWLLTGSGGNGQAWQLLGVMALGISLMEGLRFGSDRYQLPMLSRASDWISFGLVGLLFLGGFVFSALIIGLLVGLLASWLANMAPEGIANYLRYLDREPGSLVVSGLISIFIVGTSISTYRRRRRDDAEEGRIPAIASSIYDVCLPFFFLAMIALKAFVWVGMAIIALTLWVPESIKPYTAWLDVHSREIIATAICASVVAPFAILAYRRRSKDTGDHQSSLNEACWPVFWVLTCFGLSILLLAVAASLLA
ncbi:hypothetical protein [Hyphomicrobium sp. DMF-1]|uniref:hypothetical protein n=1 Tax=Hyphomicrobium sp. DMF-1 TaxID=3019544 RepID=UPI0022EC14F3|nr:hypothetical protein [Hyphomicrobium sp. DMF-1]WBT39047.1 hypothetical protein PE058_03985 [Hyphomicrobium sp. DMF-1]